VLCMARIRVVVVVDHVCIIPYRGDSLETGVACAVCLCATSCKTTAHAAHT
jgi:hypothetical protein